MPGGTDLRYRRCSAVRLAHAAGSGPTRPRPPRRSSATRPPLQYTSDHREKVLLSHAGPVHVDSIGELWLEADAWRGRRCERYNLPLRPARTRATCCCT